MMTDQELVSQTDSLSLEAGRYVPPHLRTKPSSSTDSLKGAGSPKQSNSRGNSAFSSFNQQSRNDSYKSSSNSINNSFGSTDRVYQRKAGPSKPDAISDPNDPFYGRSDVKPRNQRYELELFGSKQNSGINFDKYDDIPVDVSGLEPPECIKSFAESTLDELIKSNITLAGYSTPTPVQKNSIAIVNAGRDLMACGEYSVFTV